MLFSLNKVLLLIGILLAVWYGFKLVGRLDQARRDKQRDQPPGGGSAQSGKGPTNAENETIDLVRSKDGKRFVMRDPPS